MHKLQSWSVFKYNSKHHADSDPFAVDQIADEEDANQPETQTQGTSEDKGMVTVPPNQLSSKVSLDVPASQNVNKGPGTWSKRSVYDLPRKRRTSKRSRRSHSEDSGSDMGGTQASGAEDPPTKASALSCPFRKRNPVKFNVRDHSSCALTSFSTIALLK